MSEDPVHIEGVSCWDLFRAYFRVGLVTFGGGFAMSAVVRHELVLRRKWLTEREFINSLSTATAVPGAIAVNLAFVEGQRLHGIRGAVIAALGTMCPSILVMLLVAGFAAPYFEHPTVTAFLRGCSIAVAGQIAYAALTFMRRLWWFWENCVVCGLGLLVLLLGLHPVWAVLAAALLGYLIMRRRVILHGSPEPEQE